MKTEFCIKVSQTGLLFLKNISYKFSWKVNLKFSPKFLTPKSRKRFSLMEHQPPFECDQLNPSI